MSDKVDVIITGHVAFKVTLDLASAEWDFLKEYPREEWAEVLSDGDEGILSAYREAEERGNVHDGWLDVELAPDEELALP